MESSTGLSDLTPEEIELAISKSDENELRNLLLSKYDEAEKKGVVVKNFYYAPYVSCSDEVFDMFSYRGVESLFKLHGYSVNWREESSIMDVNIGIVSIRKGDFLIEIETIETMHDSLIADFVNTETAKIVKVQ